MSSAPAEAVRFSVTNIVTALTCPRLFWFSKVEGKSSLLGRNQGHGLGRRLHALIEGFENSLPSTPELQAAFQARPIGRRGPRIRRRLEEALYRSVLLPEITREREAGREDGEAVLKMWRGLRVYAAVLTPLLERNSRALRPEEVLRRSLLASEIEARLAVEINGEERPVEVRGRADGLWFDHSRDRAVLVEYKTRPLKGGGEDFLQLALYHWLLEVGNGVPSHGRLIPLLDGDPEEPEGSHRRGPKELRRVRKHDELQGHLGDMVRWLDWSPGRGEPIPGPASEATCEACPVRAECFRRVTRPTPSVEARPAPSGEADRIRVLLGADRGSQAPIEWFPNDTSVFVNANLAILGTMGTGKTQCTRSVLYQLARAEGNVSGRPPRFLIFDYKGDYKDPAFADVVGATVLRARHLPFNPLALPVPEPGEEEAFNLVLNTAETFVDSMARAMGLGEVQKNQLSQVLEDCYSERGITNDDPASWRRAAPTIGEVAERYLSQEKVKQDKLFSVLRLLKKSELFHPDPLEARRVWDAVEGVTVIDLQGIPESLQDLTVAGVLDQIYAEMHLKGNSRVGGPAGELRELRLFLLVDEADNFMSKQFPNLRKILKEGRSFGVGVILSTQFLRHFATAKEKYHEAFSTWVVHEFGGLTSGQIKEAFGIHESARIKEFRSRLKRCGKHESLALLRQEGSAAQQVLEMRDRAFWELVGG